MNDSTNDSDILELVEGSLGDVHMRRPLDQITARGRGLRRRRRSVASAAAVGVLGASLAVALPLSGTSGQAVTAQSQGVNVDLAAWSVHTNADSTVTLTLRQLQNTDQLQQVLARAGLHVVILQLPYCPFPTRPQPLYRPFPVRTLNGSTSVTFKPSAIPPSLLVKLDYTAPLAGHPGAVSVGLLPRATYFDEKPGQRVKVSCETPKYPEANPASQYAR